MADSRVADRTSFFEFQARNRRATWRLGAVCALVVGGGSVLATVGLIANVLLVLFALVFIPSVLLLGLGLLASLTPVTAFLGEPLWSTALFLMKGFDLVGWLWPTGEPRGLGVLTALVAVGSWLAVRQVWLAAGVGETLLAMGARAPAPGDLEEQQLVNVVTEMAIAAGITPPGVRLLDAGVANAAAVGFDGGERYVVVGRRLLDEFDRDETQSVVGHLVAAIGNGDLRGAAQIQAMLYGLDLLLVVALAPFARLPRRVARRWLLFPLRSLVRSPARRAQEARALIRLLQAHRAALPDEGGERGDGHGYFGPVGRVLVRVVPPLMALILFGVVAIASLLMAASVPVALLWRSRRYLADATAVQLTRNPTGLYRALAHLAECGATVPGGDRVAHLFIVGLEVHEARLWLDQVRARARHRAGLPPAAARRAAAAPSGGPPAKTKRGVLAEYEGLMGMHPALRRRLARLVRMGAVPPAAPAPRA